MATKAKKKNDFNLFDIVSENLGKTSLVKKIIETKERIHDKISSMNDDMMKDEVQKHLRDLIYLSNDEDEFLEKVIDYIRKLHKQKDIDKISYLEFHLHIHDKSQREAKKEIKGYYLYKIHPEQFEDEEDEGDEMEIPISINKKNTVDKSESESVIALKKIGDELKKEFNLKDSDIKNFIEDIEESDEC